MRGAHDRQLVVGAAPRIIGGGTHDAFTSPFVVRLYDSSSAPSGSIGFCGGAPAAAPAPAAPPAEDEPTAEDEPPREGRRRSRLSRLSLAEGAFPNWRSAKALPAPTATATGEIPPRNPWVRPSPRPSGYVDAADDPLAA